MRKLAEITSDADQRTLRVVAVLTAAESASAAADALGITPGAARERARRLRRRGWVIPHWRGGRPRARRVSRSVAIRAAATRLVAAASALVDAIDAGEEER